jgi:hypothetical protein
MIKILTILITVFFICIIIYNLYENNYLKFPSFQLFPIIEGAKTINLASAIKSTVTKNISKIASATGVAGLIKNILPKKKPPQIKFTDLQNKMNDINKKHDNNILLIKTLKTDVENLTESLKNEESNLEDIALEATKGTPEISSISQVTGLV